MVGHERVPDPPTSEQQQNLERRRWEEWRMKEQTRAERNSYGAYPHMCRDGHDEIGWSGGDHELCPICRAKCAAKEQRRRDFEAGYYCQWLKEEGRYIFDPLMKPGDAVGAFQAYLTAQGAEDE